MPEDFIQITVSKTGAAAINVKLPLGTTIGQALTLIDGQPAFAGKVFQKFVTTIDGRYIDSLIGATGVNTSQVLVDGDAIAYVSKVDAGA